MPATALQHFTEDIARARAISGHANGLPYASASERMLRSDLLRSSWMLAVGALDAYFCDAYTDVVAATAGSKSRQPDIVLPEWAYEIKLPLRAVLESYNNANWRWRMAARKLMERENVLGLETISKLFNKFFRKGRKFFVELFDQWIVHPEATFRMFDVSGAEFAAMTPAEMEITKKVARPRFEERFDFIIQRRHDCIHNCDRPRNKPQPLDKAETVLKVIQDIDFLVHRCDEHIGEEFRQFLVGVGCSKQTITKAGY